MSTEFTKEEMEAMLAQDIENQKSNSMTYEQMLSHREYLNRNIKRCEKKGIDTWYLQRELDELEENIDTIELNRIPL